MSSLIFYWFIPLNKFEFYQGYSSDNFNFTLNDSSKEMQFYENMRYSDPKISYRILDCTLQKRYNIERAFEMISNTTSLSFYEVEFNEEIFATCDSRNKIEGELFIAGEGGPVNITKTENFNVILKGEILLIKESKCEKPNIALHELFHSLGFDHSPNPSSIMYNTSKCNQNIGQDIVDKINELYSSPSYPDLTFENVSAIMHGKYLDTNITIRNHGLKDSEKTKLIISSGEKIIKETEIDSLKIGYGITMSLNNILVPKINIQELKFLIDSNFSELKKNNNEIKLEIKK
jgi:hypothetical protein|tara:strand:- start:443 stop:1312 length:870 start_codon:yes stop_codon:yes gene_type:complete